MLKTRRQSSATSTEKETKRPPINIQLHYRINGFDPNIINYFLTSFMIPSLRSIENYKGYDFCEIQKFVLTLFFFIRIIVDDHIEGFWIECMQDSCGSFVVFKQNLYRTFDGFESELSNTMINNFL